MPDALQPLVVSFRNDCNLITFDRTGYAISLPSYSFGVEPDQISQQCSSVLIPGDQTTMAVTFPSNVWTAIYGTDMDSGIDMHASWYCNQSLEWGIRLVWPKASWPYSAPGDPVWYYWISDKVGGSPTWVENQPASAPLLVSGFRNRLDLVVTPTVDDLSLSLDVTIRDSKNSPDRNKAS